MVTKFDRWCQNNWPMGQWVIFPAAPDKAYVNHFIPTWIYMIRIHSSKTSQSHCEQNKLHIFKVTIAWTSLTILYTVSASLHPEGERSTLWEGSSCLSTGRCSRSACRSTDWYYKCVPSIRCVSYGTEEKSCPSFTEIIETRLWTILQLSAYY